MLGTVVNALAILAGGAAGLLAGRAFPERVRETVVQGMGLAVLLVGLRMTLRAEASILPIILALALGGALGRLAGLEDRLEGWGERLGKAFGAEGFARGFIAATLLFCVGAMAIVGAMEGGLEGRHDTLLAKAALDGLIAVALAASLGIGVIFSALPVFLYQGAVVLLARVLARLLLGPSLAALTGAGGLLIVAIGLNLIGASRIRVADLLPAILVAPLLGAWH